MKEGKDCAINAKTNMTHLYSEGLLETQDRGEPCAIS